MPGDAATSRSPSGFRMLGARRTGPMTASSISRVTAPGRRIVGSPTSESTVDSTPYLQGPPSRISGIRPSMSARTCCAVVGLGLPERFALGAAIGTPDFWIRSRAVLSEGIRTATVSSPAVTSYGTSSALLKINVRGPGQNVSISVFASFGTCAHRNFTSLFFAMCRISGLSFGRPFASKIRLTASPSMPFAPSP